MRLFIAIGFNAETKNALLEMRNALRENSGGGSFTLPENLHLTLAFLGECSEQQAAAAKSVLDMTHFEPFGALIERVGRFKRGAGEELWYAGLQGSKPLLDLQRGLCEKLIGAGFKLDTRKFNPHITLGRRVVAAAAPWKIEPIEETVHGIDLMKSERINGKMSYTVIYSRGSIA